MIEGLSVVRLTTPPPAGAGIASADRGASGIATDYILTSRTHREQRCRTGSGIDPENARLHAIELPVARADEDPMRRIHFRSAGCSEGGADASRGDGHARRNDDLTFHASLQTEYDGATGRSGRK